MRVTKTQVTKAQEGRAEDRAKTTVYVKPALLRAAKVEAARTGKHEYEIFEEALRSYLGLEVLERAWLRSDLTEEEALKLAYREIHAARK